MRFSTGWLSAGIAALLLTTGCKESGSEQRAEQATASEAVEQAQDRSEQAFDQAEAAQQEAGDQQKQAAQAQQEAEEARGELMEAEAKAQAELQQAQQAQQTAQQTQQQAQQTVTEAQTSALEAQRQQQTELTQQNTQQPTAQAPLPSTPAQGEQLIIGEVLTASEQEVMVSVQGEPQLRLQLEPTTEIIVNGRQGRAADIREGSQVRASYRDSEGEQQAVRIEVTSSPPPGLPATPESGESSPGVQPQPPLNQ